MRRRVLSMFGLALLLVAVLVPPPLALADNEADQVSIGIGNLQLGSLSTPLTLDEASAIRNDVLNRSKSILDRTDKPLVYEVPEIQEGQKLVAYGFWIDKEGIPSQYVGITGDEKSVSLIHKAAQEWYATERANNEKNYKARGPFTEIGRFFNNSYLSPYGGVTNNQIVYWLSNDGSSTYDWFAVEHIFAMEPGCQVYGSAWWNNQGYPQTNWAYGSLEYGLFDWDPLGPHTGQQTISVSLTGGTGGGSATIGWSYTQPEIIQTDQSSTSTNIAKWTMTENSSAARTSTIGMKPGSTCQTYQKSSGSGTYLLYRLTGQGKFRKDNPWPWPDNYYTLTQNVDAYIIY